MKQLSVIVMVLVVLVGGLGVSLAAAPEREEQFVYGISAWDGKEYSSTFSPKGVDLYLLAGENHVLNAVKTDVYFWDITQEWMGNWMEKRVEVEGDLEILDASGKAIQTLAPTAYAYRFQAGGYTPTEMLKGADAQKAYEQYKSELERYYNAVNAYRDARIEYEQTLNAMVEEVQKTGKPYPESKIPQPPVEPTAPTGFVTQPEEAFILNLPAGSYQVRMVANGQPVPDTERRLTVFAPRRHGVGYEILPESKWTRPVMSDDRSEMLYLHGKRTMYLKAFTATEYSAHSFQRMTQAHKPLAGAGLEGVWQWQHGQELSGVTVELLQDGEVVQSVSPAPYYVQQTPGYALGYEIVAYDATNPAMASRNPSFTAFKVVLEPGSYVLRVVDDSGKVVPGSIREIRTVKQQNGPMLYLLAALPLLVGFVLVGSRRLKGRSRSKTEAA